LTAISPNNCGLSESLTFKRGPIIPGKFLKSKLKSFITIETPVHGI
jgi:hypothetical protein